jgi:hypothetical protein
MAHDPELSPEEAELLRAGEGRGYTPKRKITEPEEAPGGPAGTSHDAGD